MFFFGYLLTFCSLTATACLSIALYKLKTDPLRYLPQNDANIVVIFIAIAIVSAIIGICLVICGWNIRRKKGDMLLAIIDHADDILCPAGKGDRRGGSGSGAFGCRGKFRKEILIIPRTVIRELYTDIRESKREIERVLFSHNYKNLLENRENVWKKSVGFLCAKKYIKIEFADDNTVLISGWIRDVRGRERWLGGKDRIVSKTQVLNVIRQIQSEIV